MKKGSKKSFLLNQIDVKGKDRIENRRLEKMEKRILTRILKEDILWESTMVQVQ